MLFLRLIVNSLSGTQPRVYQAVAFDILRTMADEAAGILVANGALGCEVVGPAAESQANGSVLLRSYFERVSPATVKRLYAILKNAGMIADGRMAQVKPLVDPGWSTMWQRRFAPTRLGARFLIVPPWERACEPGRIQIIIRPGQAFGTGHHPSTALTLKAIEELCGAHHFEYALDVGSGSGILAIAMAKLGVKQIDAIDLDKTALDNASENAMLNRVSRRIRLSVTPLSAIRRRFRLITANILSSTLIQMAPDLNARLACGGYIVLSGILRREAESVAAVYRQDLSFVGAKNGGAWTALMFQATQHPWPAANRGRE
jgi:ribosomal protein L11 methyltransferase